MRTKIRSLTLAAIVAALYTALSMTLPMFAAGPVQFRAAEALTLLPICFAPAIPGLAVGCLLTNLLFGYGVWDVVFGTLATLLAAILTRKTRRHIALAAAWPVLINALVIGTLLHFVAGAPLAFTMLTVGLGQLGACYALGIPLVLLIRRLPLMQENDHAKIPESIDRKTE